MPKPYVFRPEALSDLQKITRYIAEDNPAAARRMKANIEAACRQLCYHPSMGQVREDLTSMSVRFWPVSANYPIVYDPVSEPVSILRVLHTARFIPHILQ